MTEAAVRPGMVGGQYKPLTEMDMQRIHETALKLLETVGLAQAIPSCVEAMTARGCSLNAQGRLCIPRSLVEDILASCARNFVLHGRDPKHDMEPSGNRVYFGTAGAAVHIVEPATRTYRESYLADLYDAARIVDNCDNIHFFQRALTARDMITGHDLDINTMYACLCRHRSMSALSMVEPAMSMNACRCCTSSPVAKQVRRERGLRVAPTASSPLMKFAEDACRCLEGGARRHAGTAAVGRRRRTSPAACRHHRSGGGGMPRGLVLHQPRSRRYRHLGPWPFVSDCAQAPCRAARANRRSSRRAAPRWAILQPCRPLIPRRHVRFKIAGHAGRL
jgi:trimethylamine--corrinoid protein Co-methyltransferase